MQGCVAPDAQLADLTDVGEPETKACNLHAVSSGHPNCLPSLITADRVERPGGKDQRLAGLRRARTIGLAPTLRFRLGGLPLWGEVLAVGLVLAPGTTLIYRLAAARDLGAPAPPWLDTPLDQLLPVIPAAVWVYLSWYAAMVVLPTLGGRAGVRQGAVAVVIAFILCSIGHVWLPFSIERPFIDPAAGPSAQVLAWFYTFDPPRNLFPSFHAAGAALLVPLQPTRGSAWAVTVWVIALCASCVLIKQHYLIDVIAGVGVGLVAAALARRAIVPPLSRVVELTAHR